MKPQLRLHAPARPDGHRISPKGVAWRISASIALVLALHGCGGGGGSDEPPAEPPPAMSGTVSDGVVLDTSNSSGLDVTVKGSAGIARTTSAVAKVTTTYSVTLDKLAPPYLLSGDGIDGDRLLAPATRAGTANLTPLTTLITAWILAAEPAVYFDNTLSGDGGVPSFTGDELTTAQAEVTRYLTRVTGVEVSAAIASANWVTAPMQNAPGDPMFDQIVVLNAAMAANGSRLADLAANVATQRQRCDRASVVVAGSGLNQRFCQKDSTAADANGGSTRIISFSDIEGSTLSVSVTDGIVDNTSYTTREGTFACEDATACAGVTIGELTADDTVPVVFAALALRSPDGATVALNGTLAGAGALPTLQCVTDKLNLVDPAGGVQGLCMYEASTTSRGALQVYNWGSRDSDKPYYLELVADGASVNSIDVWWFDPMTGNPLTLYRCVGGGCAGATIGDPYDSVDGNGEPVRVRDFALGNVALAAVDGEGRLGDTVAMTLSATLTNEVLSAGFVPDCSTSVEHNAVTYSDATPPIDVCPPPPSSPDYDSFKGASSYYIPGVDDAVDFSVSTYVLEQDGGRSALNTLHVVLSGDTVLKAFLQTTGDSRSYSCTAGACAGLVVSPLDAQGQRTITFDGMVLAEDPVRQLPATGVTATVTGGFLSLPDPNFVPPSAAGQRTRPQARKQPGSGQF